MFLVAPLRFRRICKQWDTSKKLTIHAIKRNMNSTENKPAIYLIPTTLGDSDINSVIPANIHQIVTNLRHFIVEDVRTARRYLKKIERSINIDELTFYTLNKRTRAAEVETFLAPIKKGESVGIISEAGCPGVADPGADIVKIAHQKKMKVVPLVGPSSILLSLMASGMNGQNFAFVGYIPIKKPDRIKYLRKLEQRSQSEFQTQIFIEAPYRNEKLLEDIISTCAPQTRVCVACDITLESEYIVTKTAEQWKKGIPKIHKRPTIFLIQG